MKIVVECPCCNRVCKKVLDKTMSINKDMLFECPVCKRVIAIRVFKTKYSKLW